MNDRYRIVTGTVDNNGAHVQTYHPDRYYSRDQATAHLSRIARDWRTFALDAVRISRTGPRPMLLAVRLNDTRRCCHYRYAVAVRTDADARPTDRTVGPWFRLPWANVKARAKANHA